ncbi:MAG: carboxypeptidase-like regulatory domain-containing protein [Candidatus Nomurabacteria bacterium]|nr:carboxypeptidase-like regulatory domain-containing protein [Candidatus Nomurabacteria bacterium]
MQINYKKYLKYIFLSILLLGSFQVRASTTNGTIDSTNHTAQVCETAACLVTVTSPINFGYFTNNPASNVHVTSDSLSGYIWGASFGWVVLNCSNTTSGCGSINGNFKVANNTSGQLSGYAWGQTSGWVNFGPFSNSSATPVVINNLGQFNGYAWSQNNGWIKFDCSSPSYCVTTDWRPGSDVVVVTPPDNNGGSISFCVLHPTDPTCLPSSCIGSDCNPTNPPVTYPVLPVVPKTIPSIDTTTVEPVLNNINPPEIFQSKTSGFVTKIITETSYLSLFPVLHTKLSSLLKIFSIIIYLLILWLLAFIILKRNHPWGVVYSSVTKLPIDMAKVVLQDLQGNNIATAITDIDGRYGFMVPEGKYKIIVIKNNYQFPSQKIKENIDDELYINIYRSELVTIKEGEIVKRNIPIDPVVFDMDESKKQDPKTKKFYSTFDLIMYHILIVVFYSGFALSSVSVLVSDNIYNLIIFGLYVLLFILKDFIFDPSPLGYVTNKRNGKPVSFGVMKVYSVWLDHEIAKNVANKSGKYYCLVPNGDYYVRVENINADGTYSVVYTSNPIKITKGYINNKFKIYNTDGYNKSPLS